MGVKERSCSKQFDQLYIIHGEVQIFSSKVRLPLVYVLMPDRKTEIYDHVFKTLIDKCTELFGVRLKPSLIKIDFEQVVLKSLQKHFPESKISIWNVCGEEHRTNNTCEGYNNRLNRAVRTLHPNIYELITVLQLEEASTRLTIHQTESGEPPKKRRKLYKNLNDKLAKFLVEYRQGDRPIKCYLKAVGYILKL